jgi:hypothetical protein
MRKLYYMYIMLGLSPLCLYFHLTWRVDIYQQDFSGATGEILNIWVNIKVQKVSLPTL